MHRLFNNWKHNPARIERQANSLYRFMLQHDADKIENKLHRIAEYSFNGESILKATMKKFEDNYNDFTREFYAKDYKLQSYSELENARRSLNEPLAQIRTVLTRKDNKEFFNWIARMRQT